MTDETFDRYFWFIYFGFALAGILVILSSGYLLTYVDTTICK